MRIALPSALIVCAACSISGPAAAADAGGGDGYWSTLNWPPARYGHTAVYDPERDRMIAFGGYDGTGYVDGPYVWLLTLSEPARWTGLRADGTPPNRYTHSAIHDPLRDRLIVFGGFNAIVRNDVMQLPLTGPPIWSTLLPSGAPPPSRHRHTAVYDPNGDRMIVFGGTNDTTLFADVWSLSLTGDPVWSEITPAVAGPVARYRHSAIYDPVRDRMIVFGGRGASGDLNDTWALDLGDSASWSRIEALAPLPRTRGSHVAVYAPAGDRMVVQGGIGSTRNDCWSLALSGAPAWSLIAPAGSPPSGHSSHSAILDVPRNRLIVFAGETDSGAVTRDLSMLTLGAAPAWSHVPEPLGPPPMSQHTAVHDPVGSRLILFGGQAWSLALDPAPLWSKIETADPVPSPRYNHVSFYDRLRQQMLVYSGFGGVSGDVWTLALSGTLSWTSVPSYGETPAPTYTAPRAFYDPVRDRMIFFLSYDEYLQFPTLWAMPMAQPGRFEYLPTGPVHPPQSESPNIIYDPVRDRLILFGGCHLDGIHKDELWAISLRARQWTQLTTLGPTPAGRCRYSAVYDPIRDRMVMIGGSGSPVGEDSNEIWELTLTEPMTWRQLSFSPPVPPTLRWAAAAAIPNRDWIMVQGGAIGSMETNGTWILEGGRPAAPSCEPGETVWGGSNVVTLRYALSHPLESARALTWTLKSERAWPMLPRQGVVIAEAAARETVVVQIVVPDSAQAGTNRLAFGVSFTGADGAEVTSTRDLHVPLATLDVPSSGGPFSLRVGPNPARREILALFSLPAAGRATLELFDVAGRRVTRRDLSLGEGSHSVPVAPGARLAPGLYVVKLSAGGSTLRARAVVIE